MDKAYLISYDSTSRYVITGKHLDLAKIRVMLDLELRSDVTLDYRSDTNITIVTEHKTNTKITPLTSI